MELDRNKPVSAKMRLLWLLYRDQTMRKTIAGWAEITETLVRKLGEQYAGNKIIKSGKASSNGSGATAYGIGWRRQILKIYNDREYPYQVGNSSGTTGFYKKDALEKI